MSQIATGLGHRLDVVAQRLSAHAARGAAAGRLTAADPPTGERWEEGQVWAHVAEFIPYWISELGTVIDDRGGPPVPFGRTKSDAARLGAIERDRRGDRHALWLRVASGIESLRGFIAAVPSTAWGALGAHPTRGEMRVSAAVDEFLVRHLEEHADQLDELGG